jgi:hypothetical protein
LAAGRDLQEDIAMTEEQDRKFENRGTRIMWISSAVILLIIVGGMGLNMYFNPDAGKGPSDMSSQSRTK